ncbi:restriction endonuclease subunit S [Methyloversatilis sp. XJ19-13]|uniref:restriction endonuclease subunit S n=1 Tax=Methyloversatilis sp. XJ19-13 TaxID=2963430 RepID=UPI00211CE703|nr:restriction endonuclease subunit S [Methyloversatilis sp. XJ19-13]MCQ9374918.1 restriction endonuclease subunit S [Methyloversatilis sp. XJ19-13]
MSSKTRTSAAKEEARSVLVPKLRFPEFRGARGWQFAPLHQLATRAKQKNRDEKITRVLTNSAEFGVVDQRDFFDKDIATQGNLESYYVVELGSYVYNPRISATAPVGPISKNKIGTGVMSPLYTVFKFKDDSNDLYEHYFKTTGWHTYMRQASSTGARHDRMAISSEDFLAMPLPVSAPEEQQKIAECLSSVDELIAAQARKVDALKTHKKGLMQQLFPREGETQPRFRFPEFRKAGEWVRMSIQEMIDQQFIAGHLDGNHGELYPKAEEFSKNKEGIPYITANDFINGSVDFSRCKRLPVERARLFKKGVAKNGDILFAHNATVGPVAKLSTAEEFVILSTTATYFRCNAKDLSNDFLKSALSSPDFVAQYSRVMSQSTRDQIPITTQRKLELQIPKPPEQQRIASCLSSLEAQMIAEAHKLEFLKTHKKGLMQQLFPSPEEVDA